MSDALTLDAPSRTQDGYLAVRAKAARTGVYEYSGREVDPDNAHGLRDEASVNVLRDAETVFDAKSAHSFIGKPITDDHPRESVNASNWKDHARGTVMGAKWEEGGYLAFDLLLTDAAAIDKVDSGKRGLSNGYQAALEFGDFAAPDGTKCPVRQSSIAGNHIAIVDRGRAGSECRIADAAPCDAAPRSFLDSLAKEKIVKTMLIDGLTVDIANADTAEATIKTLLAARDMAQTAVATLTTDKATLEAKAATLEKQLADASNPQALRDAAQRYATVTGKAKALGVAVTDAMDETAIIKAVVDAKLGDVAKGWNEAQYAASFAALTKDAKVEDSKVVPIGMPQNIGDAATAYADARAARFARLETAHTGKAA